MRRVVGYRNRKTTVTEMKTETTIIIILITITGTILDTVMNQPEKPICEKEGNPIPYQLCEALDQRRSAFVGDRQ